jgi:hypothetical protein
VRDKYRFRNSRPAAWLFSESVKKTFSHVLRWVVGRTEDRGRFWGDVALAISRVKITRGGPDQDEFANQVRTVECDLLRDHSADRETEKIDLRQSETIDERFRFAMPAKVVGTSPVELATPALLKVMTSRSLASPSRTAGSQLSRFPVKCWLKTRGKPFRLPQRREANAVGLNKLGGNCRRCISVHVPVVLRDDR